MSERQPWERMEEEPGKWYARFLVFRDQGATQRGLYQAYAEEARKSQKKPAKNVPGAWKDAADRWQWHKRADAYDEYQHAEEEAKAARLKQLEEEEEARLLSTGYARSARRVEQLSLLFDELKASYREEGKLDGKVIYQWLHPDKVREMRGCLDDIAKEVGGRIKKTELSGKDGGPMEYICEWGGGGQADDEEGESDGRN